MRLDSPSKGAISIAPFSFTHSACTPRAAKCLWVRLGYLVATRNMAPTARIVGRSQFGGFGNRNPAMANIEINRRVEFRIIELINYVR